MGEFINCSVTRKEDVSADAWSGGSTAQLFIYPPDSAYANRDFAFRISSAVVEQEISAFTHLPGYRRILMPLTAPLLLVYQGHGKTGLKPLETAEFDGDWHTVSHGICTDLGIMLAGGWLGEMKAVGGGTYTGVRGFTAVYALTGVEVGVEESGEPSPYALARGDLLMLESPDETKCSLALTPAHEKAEKTAVLIRVFRE